MDIEELEKEWNKITSLWYLFDKRINTPTFHEAGLGDLENLRTYSMGERMSVRTFKRGVPTILAPHFPNIVIDKAILDKVKALLKQSFQVIISEPIDPSDCLWRGNIVYIDDKEWLLEYAKGPGTVREMEKLDSGEIKRIKQFSYNIPVVPSRVTELGLKGDSVVSIAKSLFWGTPILLEWSIYKHPVGYRNRELIFWELRRA